MKLKEIIQEVMTINILTPGTEKDIDELLWSQELDKQDMEALERLIEGLSKGTIVSLVKHQ